jgi:hypothetical protein
MTGTLGIFGFAVSGAILTLVIAAVASRRQPRRLDRWPQGDPADDGTPPGIG